MTFGVGLTIAKLPKVGCLQKKVLLKLKWVSFVKNLRVDRAFRLFASEILDGLNKYIIAMVLNLGCLAVKIYIMKENLLLAYICMCL